MTEAPDGAPIPQLKDRPLTFAGRQWTLRLSFIAMGALKERWKIEDDNPLIRRLSKKIVTDIPALLWACMLTHHPETTYPEILKLCDDGDLGDVRQAHQVAQDALAAGWGSPEKKPPAAATTKGPSAPTS